MLCASQYLSNACEVYCVPRSEWKITPAGGRRWVRAMSNASVIREVRMWSAAAQPTRVRECRSMTVATYAHLSQVLMYVMSPHQRSLTRSAVKDRPIRSGAETGCSPGLVVVSRACGKFGGRRPRARRACAARPGCRAIGRRTP